MIKKLKMSLLGVPQITLDEESLIGQLARREQALLFYLAVNGQVRSRSAVASLLWDAVLDAQALKNLRDVLPNLRKRLGSHLLITHQSVGFNRQGSYWLDVETFQHTVQARTPSKPAALHNALELYRGEFLEDFFVRDAPGFEEWLLLQRQQMHTLAAEGWQRLTNHYIEQGEKGFGLIAVRRLLGLEPWRESAHQQLMRLLMRSGQRGAALAQYEICLRALADGLEVVPSAETVALYEAILSGKFDNDQESAAAAAVVVVLMPNEPIQPGLVQPGASVPATTAHNPEPVVKPAPQLNHPERTRRGNWNALPAVNKFYGREQELAQVERWLLQDQCQVVTIFGIGGQGKTTLAAKIVHTLAEATENPFDVILWQSLVNAPPLAEILQSWLPILSKQQVSPLPTTHQQQFALLLDYLQQQRCLLVLDNLESIILDTDDYNRATGAYRPGYENYGELIRCFGETEHQSCLLITSREQPIALARMEENRVAVRSLQLEGLSKEAGQAMLYGYGLTNPVETVNALTQNYSGNPLALTLVGETIWDLFDGDIAAFAREDSLIFGDIRHVLDQQFARLNLLDREILFWLAIEREPVSLATLRHNLVQPEAKRAIFESLRTLLRRALLEKQGESYSLQNVIMEYMTNLLVEKIGQEIRIAPWLAHNEPVVTSASYYTSSTRSIDLSLPFPESRLNRFALIKAKAKAYVRESQTRLILKPLAEQLVTKLGKPGVEKRCQALLHRLQTTAPLLPGYAAANLLHLLLHLETDLHNYDFSQLVFWQANLQGVRLPPVTFAHAQFRDTLFTEPFSDVTALAFFPNNQYLAAATRTGGIFLWRLADQSLYHVLSGHTDTTFIALSADGERLASASADGTLRLWQLTNITEMASPSHILAQQSIPFTAVVFSPDGRLLASGSDDGTVCLWDGITGAPGPILYKQTSAVLTLTFASVAGHGLVLASAGDSEIYLWALETERLLANWSGHHDLIWTLAFSPDGCLLVSGSADRTVRLWQITTDTIGDNNNEQPPSVCLEGHTAHIYAVAFSPDGKTLVTSGFDENMRLWDVQTRECQLILRMHKSWVRAVAFSPDGKSLASGGNDHTIGLWHITPSEYTSVTSQLDYILTGHASFARSVAFSPQATTLASSHADGLVRLWNTQNGELQYSLRGHVGAVHGVAFSPNGQQLASIGNDGVVQLWKMPGGQLAHSLPGYDGALRALAFNPDGEILAVGGNRPYVQLWNTQTGQRQRTLAVPFDQIWSAAFSPDGQILATGTHAQGILLWDVVSGKLRGTFDAAQNAVLGLAFHPGGELLIGGSVDRCVRVWDIRSGRLLYTLSDAAHWVYTVAVSPAGNLLAAGTVGGIIYMWAIEQDGDTTNVRLRHRLHGHTIAVNSVAFSPSGNLLVSGATDETIRFWDVESGACVNSLYAEGPYSGMNITGVTGLTEAQKADLVALGAVEKNVPRGSINPSSIATMLKAPNNVGQISLSWS